MREGTMVSQPKFRHEFKYPITACDRELLKSRLAAVMKLDKHAGPDGTYNIRSLYFDNYYNKAYFEKVDGANPRAKFRIRVYNCSDKIITLEKKVKNGELTQKLQAKLTREQYDKIIRGDIDWMLHDGRGVVAELYAQMKGYSLKPKVLVEYQRMPFVYDPGNVRVTIDMNIRSGIFSNNLFDPTPLVHTGELDVLEVKYDAFLPDIIRYLISPVSRDRQSVSKYEICRKFG